MKFLTSLVLLTLGGIGMAQNEPKIIFEQDQTLLTTTVHMLVLSGSADDAPKKAGLTNLMAELMLRGTKKRPREKFQSELEKLGAMLSVKASQDHILFSGKVIKENTNAFLELIEDCLLNPTFSAKEFESLKQETLAELANNKNQNTRLAGLALRKELFAGTPLEHPVQGGMSTLKGITLSDIQKTYNDRLNRGNLIFGIASPFKEEEIKKKIGQFWSKLPDGFRNQRKQVALKLPSKTKLIVINKPGASTGSMILGQAGITASEPKRYALNVGNFSFGGEPLVSRLFLVVRKELGWTYSIGSTYGAFGNLSNQKGVFVISTTPSIEFTAKTLLKTLSMWNSYYTSGLKSEEMTLAQDSMVNSYPFEFDSAEKRLGLKLHSYLYEVPILSPEAYGKTIQEISNDALKESIKGIHTKEGWIVTLVADSKVIADQLEKEQAETPEADRIKISEVFTPEQVIE